uniref:Chemokine interleukin-8-like domain-containing protein n=1 Tax=Acanthochromis polyacanthus TaxID=80966 RepID=A0A3Q1GHQ6_9TELE
MRMAFSSFGHMCFVILFLLFSQGCPKSVMPHKRISGHVQVSCCPEVRNGTINEPVKECFEQKETTFRHCRVHAFVFITASSQTYCVDPNASWLPERLKKLERRGIYCQPL